MRHDFIDRYSRIESPIHRLSAMVKLVVSFCLILLVISFPVYHHVLFASITGFLLVLLILSKIPLKFIIGRLLLLETFTLGIALLALLKPNGVTVFLSIFIKSTLCLLTVILLSNSTPFSELTEVLKRLKIPSLIITILALMYRYIFVLIDELERMVRARESRSFIANRMSRWMVLASIVGQLFIRSTERAERIYAAMSARGWK